MRPGFFQIAAGLIVGMSNQLIYCNDGANDKGGEKHDNPA